MKDIIKKYSVFLVILLLSIGFALVTTNLIINNNASIGTGVYDIKFSSATTDDGGSATISPDGKSISFSSKQLSLVGDEAVLNYTITNYSSDYDANIRVNVDVDDDTYNDYYSIDHQYPSSIIAKASENGKLTIILEQAIIQDVNISFTITMDVDAVERAVPVDDLSPKDQSNIVSYVDSTLSLANPDRGLYGSATFVLNTTNNQFEGSSSIEDYLTSIKDNHYGLTHIHFDISALSGKVNSQGTDLSLTTEMTNSLESILKTIQDYGYTTVIRFSYDNEGVGGREPLAWSTIQSHIETLAASLNKYKSCIASVDAGFLGKWGEMHKAGDYENDESYRKLIDALMTNLDKDIKINVRRPYFYELYFGSLTPDNENRYRLGIFNDGMFGSETDIGTIEVGTRDDYINWLNNQGKYTLYGGEASKQNVNDEDYLASDEIYSDYPHVLDEMLLTHPTYLNSSYNRNVLQDKWGITTYDKEDEYKGLTFLKYVTDHLGYRYIVRSSIMDVEVEQGNNLSVSLDVENTGFAPAINEYDAYFILKQGNNYYEAPLQYDIRNIESRTTSNIRFGYSIPSNITTGKWDVYIKFTRKNNYNASISFANPNIFDSTIKANKIGQIDVVDGETTDINFVQLDVENAVVGELKTIEASPDEPLSVRVSSSYYDYNDHSIKLGNVKYNVQPGTTINYADPTVRTNLGIIIPEGYEFHDVRSELTNWEAAQTITIPSTYTDSTYTIEVYLKSTVDTSMVIAVYDNTETRLSKTSFKEKIGTVIDLSDFSSLTKYGVTVPDGSVFDYGTSAVVNWEAITTFEVPTSENEIYLEIHLK